MATQERGRPLPKFGEWDVKNPASAEGFTVIFNIARDEKKIAKPTLMKLTLPAPKKELNLIKLIKLITNSPKSVSGSAAANNQRSRDRGSLNKP